MRIGAMKLAGLVASAVLWLSLVPAFAQTKPPESASKVKRVLLYNKIGGWPHAEGVKQVRAVMAKLAAAKGFELVESDKATDLTPEFLLRFQVIIWNNCSGGAGAVPDTAARRAVMEYLHRGGGWMLIHGAANEAGTWAGLYDVLGTIFTQHTLHGVGEMVLDGDALAHKELKWMLEGIPRKLAFDDSWDSYQNTVRPLPGVTVIATAGPVRVGSGDGLEPTGDASGDQVYGWAREVGQGRMIFTPLGHGERNLMAQQDSIIPKLYWQYIRYAAGDFQNGCTRPEDPRFDPEARVQDDKACDNTANSTRNPFGMSSGAAPGGLLISRGGFFSRFAAPAGTLRVSLRDLVGTVVWERTLPSGTGEVALEDAIGAGIYHIEIRGATGRIHGRLALP